MNIIPYRRYGSLDRAFGDFFKDFFDDSEVSKKSQSWAPSLDVVETETNYLVKAELPGIDEKDITITMEDGYLTITGSKESDREDKNEAYHFVERRFGKFQRQVRIPGNVDANKVKAQLKNGILEVSIEKTEESKPKSIPISSS